jgi:hypothetical protein
MAVPSSPPITLLDVVAEFGGDGDLRSYLRGGAYVPNVPENSGVPTSLPISLLDLAGAVSIASVALDVSNGSFSTFDEGTGDGSIYEGFNTVGASFGSISPTTINGQTITRIYKRSDYTAFSQTGEAYVFSVSGSVSQSFIDRITLASGTFFASTSVFSGSNTWTWDITPDGNNNVDSTIYYIP